MACKRPCTESKRSVFSVAGWKHGGYCAIKKINQPKKNEQLITSGDSTSVCEGKQIFFSKVSESAPIRTAPPAVHELQRTQLTCFLVFYVIKYRVQQTCVSLTKGSGSLVVVLLENLQHSAAQVSSYTLKIPFCTSVVSVSVFSFAAEIFSAVTWPGRRPSAGCRVPTSAQLYIWNPADLSWKRPSCSSDCQCPCQDCCCASHSCGLF